MSEGNRYRQAVRAVWQRSEQQYLGWPGERREQAEAGVAALLARLRECSSEEELFLRYWEAGDPPGVLLERHLPGAFSASDRLTLEEACFRRRLLELRPGG